MNFFKCGRRTRHSAPEIPVLLDRERGIPVEPTVCIELKNIDVVSSDSTCAVKSNDDFEKVSKMNDAVKKTTDSILFQNIANKASVKKLKNESKS